MISTNDYRIVFIVVLMGSMRLDWGIQIKEGSSGDLLLHSGRHCWGRWGTLHCQSTAQHWEKGGSYMLKSQDIMVFPPLANRIPIDFREFYPHNQSASLDQSHLGIEGVSTGKVRGIFFSTVLNNCNMPGFVNLLITSPGRWEVWLCLKAEQCYPLS